MQTLQGAYRESVTSLTAGGYTESVRSHLSLVGGRGEAGWLQIAPSALRPCENFSAPVDGKAGQRGSNKGIGVEHIGFTCRQLTGAKWIVLAAGESSCWPGSVFVED